MGRLITINTLFVNPNPKFHILCWKRLIMYPHWRSQQVPTRTVPLRHPRVDATLEMGGCHCRMRYANGCRGVRRHHGCTQHTFLPKGTYHRLHRLVLACPEWVT